MDKVRCQRCGILVEKYYIFHCPIHGDFHNDGGTEYCCKFRTRCDGLHQVCCPECGFMPCTTCYGYGVLRDDNNKKECYYCHGKKSEPFRLRKISENDIPTFKERMLFKAQEFALRAKIRYLLITISRNGDVNLKDVRQHEYSILMPLDKRQRRKFYGWLRLFSKGKNRRFMDRWEKLLE
jgi:hypothetical protein